MTITARIPLSDPDLLKTRAFIGGAWVETGGDFAVTNPADGSLVARVADAGVTETRQAIAAAHRALPDWRERTAKDRARILRRWYDLILAHRQDLGLLVTFEQGKPLAEAVGEAEYAGAFVEWFAEEGKRVYGDTVPTTTPGRRMVVVKQPIGVVAAITPWNFPLSTITRKVAPALAAGCTAVVKPAPETPLSALALAVLAERAGLPAGVLNVVPTDDAPAVGAELTANPLVRKVSFTGSTAVGKRLMAQAATTVKKVALELGGNAPFIVFDDADLDAALEGLLRSKFRNSGQACVCANRVLIQDGIYDAFAARLVEAVKGFKVGSGLEDGVTQGPLINERALAKVERLIADALAKGASLAAGGKRHALGGTFFEPTVLLDAVPGMAIAREEIFGPVASLFRFRTEGEAIAMANDTEYGLAAYFYARDIGRCWRVGEGLEYGMVAINAGAMSGETTPFGGVKESGIGREGSKYGIEEFLELKLLCMGGLQG